MFGLLAWRHWKLGFGMKQIYEIAQPLFSNRLILAAVCAGLLPLLAAAVGRGHPLHRRLFLPMGVLTILVMVDLRARSAWFGLLLALLVGLVGPALRPGRSLLLLAIVGAGLLASTSALLGYRSHALDLASPPSWRIVSLEPLLTGVDESLQERMNRWSCAGRMFVHRPLLGWGPGSFEGTYGAFQAPGELTTRSTFAGDRGGPHSVVAGASAELGAFGLLSLLLMYSWIGGTGLRAIRAARSAREASLALGATMSVVAFMANSLINDLWEQDKVMVLFWVSAAALTSLAGPRSTIPAGR